MTFHRDMMVIEGREKKLTKYKGKIKKILECLISGNE